MDPKQDSIKFWKFHIRAVEAVDCCVFRICSQELFANRRLQTVAFVCESLLNINSPCNHY